MENEKLFKLDSLLTYRQALRELIKEQPARIDFKMKLNVTEAAIEIYLRDIGLSDLTEIKK